MAFLSNRTGKNQVWKISTLGGEAIALTDVDQGISNFEFSPDGQSLALTISGDAGEIINKLFRLKWTQAIVGHHFDITTCTK